MRSGILLSLPCQACGYHGRGPRVCRTSAKWQRRCQGVCLASPPPPAHGPPRPSLCPSLGGPTGANPAKPQPLALAAPSGPALPTSAQPHSRPPPPPRPSTPHRTRLPSARWGRPGRGPCCRRPPPQHACSHTGWKHNLGTQGGAQKVGAPSLAARRPQADTPERGRLARAAELGRPRRTTRTDKIALGASQPGRQKRRD